MDDKYYKALLHELYDVLHTEGDEITFKDESLIRLIDLLENQHKVVEAANSVIDTVESDETCSPFDLFIQLHKALSDYEASKGVGDEY